MCMYICTHESKTPFWGKYFNFVCAIINEYHSDRPVAYKTLSRWLIRGLLGIKLINFRQNLTFTSEKLLLFLP